MCERTHGVREAIERLAAQLGPDPIANGHRMRSPMRAATELLVSTPSAMRERIAERFWGMAEPEPTSGCYLWTGFLHSVTGYGDFKVGTVCLPAHRVALLLERGPLAPGMEAAHSCNNRACVSPLHLRPRTHAENQRESIGRHVGVKNAGESNGNARLTDAEVLALRAHYAEGEATVASLAEAYAYSVAGMASVLIGDRYRHLPDAVSLRPDDRSFRFIHIPRRQEVFL